MHVKILDAIKYSNMIFSDYNVYLTSLKQKNQYTQEIQKINQNVLQNVTLNNDFRSKLNNYQKWDKDQRKMILSVKMKDDKDVDELKRLILMYNQNKVQK